MLLWRSTKQILDFVNLGDGSLDFVASAGPRVGRVTDELSACALLVDRDLEDVFGTTLDVSLDSKV